jgi:MFS superfamily sulfate permease-like transporter
MSLRTVSRFLPILGWLPDCTPKTLRTDLIAGIALAGLLVPEGMAYAGIAGVPPQMGLYAAMAGMFVYALFGSSRQLAVTSSSSSAAMLAALVAPIAAADPSRYVVLASGAAIVAGVIFLIGGTGTFVDVSRHPEAEQIPSLLIFRPDGMLFFANANRIRNRLRELTASTDVPLRAVVINLEASPEMDVTSLEMLEQLRSELDGSGIALYLARVSDRVRDLFDRGDFTARVGLDRIFPGVDTAANAFLEDRANRHL